MISAARPFITSGEVTYFRNSIDRYNFRNPISEEEFFARFPDEDPEEFAPIEFIAADSLLQGIEAHTDIDAGGGIGIELGLDYVRGQLRGSKDPLPRIPPFRFRGGLLIISDVDAALVAGQLR